MRKPNTKPTLPDFKNAAEKKAWLLQQLKEVELEAVWEDLAAGKDEQITIRAGETFAVTVGKSVLYEGGDAKEFAFVLSRLIQALPLGSAFMVEAGKGGKVLGSVRELPVAEEPAKPARRAHARSLRASR